MAIRTLVVGAGALGNEVIKNLALLGVRDLGIADRDRVEASNLTRSILYCTADVEQEIARRAPKAEFAARRAREINPDVSVTAHVGEIADLGAGVLRRADVVFSCLDNEMARLELGWQCARLDKRMIDGGLGLVNVSSGMVSEFPGACGPCYACRKGSERRRQLLRDLFGREDPCGQKDAALQAVDAVATTPLMASVVGALQVEVGLRGPTAPPDARVGRSWEIALHPTPRLSAFTFERSTGCPLHDSESAMAHIVERTDRRSDDWTVAAMLEESGYADGCLVLDWPFTGRAVCHGCSHEWEPLMRRARFRAATCPACGGADLAETHVVTTIGLDSPWAERTLSALRLPAAHIHELAAAGGNARDRLHVEVTGDLSAGT